MNFSHQFFLSCELFQLFLHLRILTAKEENTFSLILIKKEGYLLEKKCFQLNVSLFQGTAEEMVKRKCSLIVLVVADSSPVQ